MDNEKIMRVGCYVRVSTQEQAKEGYSIPAQTQRLKSYCAAREWVVSEIYTDPGFSGAKMDRPALQKLIQDAKKHKIDLVLVYKLDRLSRSQKDTLFLIEDVFIKNEVAFVSINENFDTSTAFGRAMIGVLSVFAQLEREQIKERTQMGRTQRAKNGLWHGGGAYPIGYDYIESTNELKINEYEALQVREVYDMYVNNQFSFNKIKNVMLSKGYRNKSGEWKHTSTIKNVLTNNIYISKITWHGEEYDGLHEAIISKKLFNAAQKRLSDTGWEKGNSPKISPFASTQLLSGILFCGNCRGRYYGSGAYRGSHKTDSPNRKYIHVYTCYSRSKTKREMIKDPTCKNKNWKAEELDQYIIDTIIGLNLNVNFDKIVEQADVKNDDLAARQTIQNQIDSLDTQMSKILDLLQFENLPTQKAVERLESVTKEKLALESSLEQIPKNHAGMSLDKAREIISNSHKILTEGTIESKRDLIQTLIESSKDDERAGESVSIENQKLMLTKYCEEQTHSTILE